MGNSVIIAAIVGIVSYLIGSINFSILISRAISGEDIRNSGSGNAGATNMLRTHGKKMGVLTLLLDVLKGIVVILLARLIISSYASMNEAMYEALIDMALPYIAGLCVVLGHNFPLYFGFKGGKGVATSLGVVMMLDWKLGIVIAVCAIAVMAVTRYVSFGSILGGAAFVVGEIVNMVVSGIWNPVKLVCSAAIGILLIVRHHANIKRLLSGTENKLGEKKAK